MPYRRFAAGVYYSFHSLAATDIAHVSRVPRAFERRTESNYGSQPIFGSTADLSCVLLHDYHSNTGTGENSYLAFLKHSVVLSSSQCTKIKNLHNSQESGVTITPSSSSTSSSGFGGSGTVNSASVGQAPPAPASANSSTNSINHHSSASSSTGVPLSGSSLAGLNTNFFGTFSERSSEIDKIMKTALYVVGVNVRTTSEQL